MKLSLYAYVKKSMLSILSYLVIGVMLLNAWFYLLQPSMLFYPYKDLDAIPTDWDLAYEDVELITSDNIRLHGWYLPVKNTKQVVLFFHGNGGNISHRGDSLKIFHELGLNVLIIDYRGYGLSEGKLSEQGLYLDAMTAWQYLINQRSYHANDIILFGRSLGGAVATRLASQVQPKAIIVESCFSSVRDMANIMMPLISKLIYLRYSLDTEHTISKVNSPVLVVHSPDDEIIPFQLGQKIFTAANTPKYFYELRGGHNDGFIESMPAYKDVIKTFLERE